MLKRILSLKNPKKILMLILVLTAFLRLYRLDYPNQYIFDEVYHAFTAQEYLKGNKDAWEWRTTPPPGVAFEWTHPPLAKEIMTASMFLLRSTDAWVWRLPGALLGVLSVFLVYKLGLKLFQNNISATLAAFLFSIDGLNFVQSRIGMNDIYFVTFFLISLLFLLNKKIFFSAIFCGLAISSKWAAIYGYIFLFVPYLLLKKQYLNLILLTGILPIIYLATYLPFFLLGHRFDQFVQLQQQMWWYHTGLKATHDYSSPWWSWSLNFYPVWYFVDYKDKFIANIFASGNPPLFWFGALAILATGWEAIKQKSLNLFLILMGFLVFWLPWAVSPRIMFLYHYAPSVPFLTLALGYQLGSRFQGKMRSKILLLLSIMVLGFILIYPFLTGIHIPNFFVRFFFFTNLTKNPF
ncbi:phospholipid carrier-dependent glycosyltransferase [Candidatus Daviesbacteria bacterium]|nr:phospholipid carrier-dependent glycosyltransferase [Candidatus Daviesbacteria bacterium]